MTDEAPHAPWSQAGECILVWVRRPRNRPALPEGIKSVPLLPAALTAVRWDLSPVGPYNEVSVGEPARLGARPGFCVTTQAVSLPAARLAARRNWGVPCDVGDITWAEDADRRIDVRWRERGIGLSVREMGPSIPAIVPPRSVQRRADGPVVVPRTMWCLMRIGTVDVVVPEDDPLAWLAGPHPGAVLRHMHARVRPARHPVGVLSSLRAPLGAPEPALSASHQGAARSRYSALSPGV